MTAWEGDVLNRKKVADFLTAFLEGDEEAKVINIDAPWGFGKTYFVTNWHQERSHSIGSVYFNAWEIDYSGEPFFDLVASIRDQLVSQAPTENVEKIAKDFLKKSAKVAIKAGPEVGKLLLKGAFKKLFSTDFDEIGELLSEASYDAAQSLVVDALEKNSEGKEAVQEFKDELINLIKAVSGYKSSGESVSNIFIFIDELDRCRPTYAIELLERVKHLFDVPGCKFVIATDTVQLSHSIRAVYGVGFESEKYLKRFFDVTYQLQNKDYEGWVGVCLKDFDISSFYDIHPALKRWNGGYSFHHNIVEPDKSAILSSSGHITTHHVVFIAIIKTFSLSLRDVQKIMLQIRTSLPSVKSEGINFFVFLYLTALRYIDPKMFALLRDSWNDRVEEELNENYPPASLYFTSCNLTVHNIAKVYVNAMTLGRDDLRDMLEAGNERAPDFVREAYINGFNNTLPNYFDIVDLAADVN